MSLLFEVSNMQYLGVKKFLPPEYDGQMTVIVCNWLQMKVIVTGYFQIKIKVYL